jgi:two-component system chemotaxis sensor kinase CheA
MDDLIKDFLVESYENLDRLDQDFVALETDPGGPDKMGSIFRTIHTIKGTCGCLGLHKLEAVAHVGENLLSRLRDKQLVMDGPITTALLRLVDAIREILGNIEKTESEGDADYSAVCAELVRLNARPSIDGAAAPAADLHHAEAPAPPAVFDVPPELQAEFAEQLAAERAAAAAAVPVAAPVAPAVAAEPLDDHAPADDHPAAAKGEKAASGESLANNAVRVDVAQLDKLMNLVGELVLTRNQVLQFISSSEDAGLLRTAQRLNLITSELQEGVMKTRMQPIGNLWNKFPRIVRDVANTCGKRIRLEMEGKETELDRTILEAIKDPLTHVIRNSVDHGVEAPDKRLAKGKPEEGVLSMRAYHEGGQVNIEIVDDGAGIDPDRVKRKAVEKGLITAEQAARMSEREAINLVFAPGFSTAEKVTNVSGRGVGMDVVKTNVEKIGGTVEITSRLGAGTTLKIKIPLTLAIIPALIVTSGGDRFCIPQSSLLELVRADGGATGGAGSGIETIHGTPVFRLRGNLLPLIYLDRELQMRPAATDATGKPTAATIVVLRGGERHFGLVVDQVNDTEEIVVKPLGRQLKSTTVFAGATIMGDGQVALILDVMGLTVRAHLNHQSAKAAPAEAVAGQGKAGAARQQMLLFKLHGDRRMAIPLSAIARLEEFPRAKVESAGGQQVVQYRGEIMPLIDVATVLGDRRRRARPAKSAVGAPPAPAPADTIQVLVYADGGRNVGLRVEQILDTVDEAVEVQTAAARPGVIGTTVLKEKVTELLDLRALVRLATEVAAVAA